MAEMTKEVIVAACKTNGGYAAPHLNDQLYLHCRGFMEIKNLEEYTEAKVLWLEQNAITDLSGMANQQKLVSLFLQNNTIRSLKTFSATLTNLRVLNISYNYVSSLEGLAAACPLLETLQASHGRITSFKACEDLFSLAATLTSVDLSFNNIDRYDAMVSENSLSDGNNNVRGGLPGDGTPAVVTDPSTVAAPVSASLGETTKDPLVIVNFFLQLPKVSVIYLQGNSVSHGLKNYRRNMILHLPSLMYLDERPVFADERRVVEAWGRGGNTEEVTERTAIREEKRAHLSSCVRVLTDKMEANRAVRDRLTAQWEVKQAAELAAQTERRRIFRDACADLETIEAAARTTIETEEQNIRWDVEEAATDAYGPLEAAERAYRHAHEQALAAQKVREEVAADMAVEQAELERSIASGSVRDYSLVDLTKSDEDILAEMEEEIQNVLHNIEASARSSTRTDREPFVRDRTTARAVRAMNAAVSQVAERLRAGREAAAAVQPMGREALWARYNRWESKVAH